MRCPIACSNFRGPSNLYNDCCGTSLAVVSVRAYIQGMAQKNIGSRLSHYLIVLQLTFYAKLLLICRGFAHGSQVDMPASISFESSTSFLELRKHGKLSCNLQGAVRDTIAEPYLPCLTCGSVFRQRILGLPHILRLQGCVNGGT